MSFDELQLIEPLLVALEKKGYTQPTPIQEQSIPQILARKDIFGCAQTGTGKTASFALPILQLMSAHTPKHRAIKALILAPTRELASQISESFSEYGENLKLRHTVIFGGVSQNPQIAALKQGIDILIATPGRLLDLINQGQISLQQIEYFVLDEADRMLDMGFIHDIKKILTKLPAKRHNIFFSATVSPEIKKLSQNILQNPVHVAVTPVSSTTELVNQSVYFVAKDNKRALLLHVLKHEKIDHVLIFTRTKHGANRVATDLSKHGIKAEAIHGNKSQNARERALEGFKNRTLCALVATDIASRGIDIEKLSHVINYEIPEVPETYVHRIGRSGRAGNEGKAISFCSPDESSYFKGILKLINKKIPVVNSHPFA